MFSKQHAAPLLELSNDVQDEADWVIGQLKEFELPTNFSTIAVDPTTKLLALGTSAGAIFIHGGPGVEVKITTPTSTGTKFLSFATLPRQLLCIDDTNQLHIWDLTTLGGPEYLKSARFDQVTSFNVSPSLSHVFVGLQSGEIKTYDLACLRKSEYTAPNMWKLFEKSMEVRGVPSMIPPSPVQPCVDQQLHPRNLNLIFVAYPGGVILCDLTQRSTVRAYEMILPPGAPGGFGYGMDDILTHRKPEVTCIAIHPSCHFFAVGHADGCMAFWAVEDDTKPLLVRTLDDDDVNHADGERLEKELDGKATFIMREPIIKLTWSTFSDSTDPRGGKSTLTVLGGLDSKHGGSVSALLFPAFQPPAPPADTVVDANTLHPFFRAAMQKSLQPINGFIYERGGEIQDYLLCPSEHLHLGGSHDPYVLICLQSAADNSRVLEAYRYPPLGWIEDKKANIPSAMPSEETTEPNPALEAFQEISATSQPELDLPFHVMYGSGELKSGRLISVENSVYEDLIGVNDSVTPTKLQLDGGRAFVDEIHADEIRLTKYQLRRIMITHDTRRRIRFFDFSAQLLAALPEEPLKHHFPNPLLGLTIDLAHISGDANIHSLSFAPEALEIAVALDDGNVIVCHKSGETTGIQQGITAPEGEDGVLETLPPHGANCALVPFIRIKSATKIQVCSLSNIGFLAVSYNDGHVTIVDMRGPRVLLDTASRSKRKSHLSHRSSSIPDVANALTWSVTPTDKDTKYGVRLMASRVSGALEIYTLSLSDSGLWSVADGVVVARGVADPIVDGTFVLDGKTGSARGSGRSLFATAVSGRAEASTPSVLVTVGAKGARSQRNLDGERLGRAEWGSKCGIAVSAQVVERMASKALLVVTNKQLGLAYSLPSLELISSFKLLPFDPTTFSVDRSGDFVALSSKGPNRRIDKIAYGTFFDIRRIRSPPDVDFAIKPCNVSQPQPVSMGPPSYLGSWLTYAQTLSGRQIDDLLGGPNRPVIVKGPAPGDPSTAGQSTSATASSIAASAATAQASIYSKLSAAMNERGQLLGDLGERFNSLETGSRNMVAQAKKMAAQQTAKSWLGF